MKGSTNHGSEKKKTLYKQMQMYPIMSCTDTGHYDEQMVLTALHRCQALHSTQPSLLGEPFEYACRQCAVTPKTQINLHSLLSNILAKATINQIQEFCKK